MGRPINQLLAILHSDASPQVLADPTLPWNDIVVNAIIVGLAPMLHQRLCDAANAVPAPVMAKLNITRQATGQRNTAIQQQLGEIVQAMDSAGVRTLVLKGAYLSPTVYPSPDQRGMSDIDLLFQPHDLPAAERVLENLGYEGKHKAAENGPGITKHTSTYKRPSPTASTPNPYLSTLADRHVDPHGSLEECWFGLCTDLTPGVWERAYRYQVQKTPAWALSPNDLYLHVTIHLIYHLLMGKPSFVQLYDVLMVNRHFAGLLDWDWLANRALAIDAAAFLAAGNQLASAMLGAPVPADVQARLLHALPPGLAKYISGLDTETFMALSQRPPLTTWGQRVQRGVSERRATARWATTWSGKWAVWRTALEVTRTDTGQLLAQRLRLTRAPQPE